MLAASLWSFNYLTIACLAVLVPAVVGLGLWVATRKDKDQDKHERSLIKAAGKLRGDGSIIVADYLECLATGSMSEAKTAKKQFLDTVLDDTKYNEELVRIMKLQLAKATHDAGRLKVLRDALLEYGIIAKSEIPPAPIAPNAKPAA